jgi:hypothetical protein
LDEHWNAKLSDFGESRFLDGQTPMTAAKGNFLWMAPEVSVVSLFFLFFSSPF